jgi:hypothetical protein
MTRKRSSKLVLVSLSLFVFLAIYVSSYLLSTEVFHGRLGDTHYRIRLFQSVWHKRIFSPLLIVEQWLRPAEPEFSGQVRSGASVPPPDDDEK